MRIVFDIEADGLLDTVSRIWCVVCIDIDTGKTYTFGGPDMTAWVGEFLEFSKKVTLWVGHNIIGYDLPVLERFTGLSVPLEQVLDTLVMSRLIKAQRSKGHSLDAWGEYLKYPKLEFTAFHSYSQEMLEYCINDVKLNHLVYQHLMRWFSKDLWKDALSDEQFLARICHELGENGFSFDSKAATSMHKELVDTLEELTAQLRVDFPPRAKLLDVRSPKVKKDGSISKVGLKWASPDTMFSPGSEFSLVEWVPFSPGSPKQVVTRLNEIGWKPIEKTKGHLKLEQEIRLQRRKPTRDQLDKLKYYDMYGWKVNESNLNTLPEDAPDGARNLVRWLLLDSRRSTLEEWLQAYNQDTGKIHGRFQHIGSWTHRMSHSAPNMANIPAVKADRFKDQQLKDLTLHYGKSMRKLWKVEDEENEWLVGCDAEGIQLRVLAHYINDPEFTKALVSGSKDDGTDAHSLNQRKLGSVCGSRDNAKTFIYAFLLGAGVAKIAEIFGCSHREAVQARDSFIEAYPGLQSLKDVVIPRDAARGYFEGLDGRLVSCDSEHLMLAGYLQNGEKVIMLRTLRLWYDRAKEIGLDYTLRNFVHDEWQTSIRGTREEAEALGRLQASCFATVGKELGLNCPLAGSFDIGKNWYDTH